MTPTPSINPDRSTDSLSPFSIPIVRVVPFKAEPLIFWSSTELIFPNVKPRTSAIYFSISSESQSWQLVRSTAAFVSASSVKPNIDLKIIRPSVNGVTVPDASTSSTSVSSFLSAFATDKNISKTKDNNNFALKVFVIRVMVIATLHFFQNNNYGVDPNLNTSLLYGLSIFALALAPPLAATLLRQKLQCAILKPLWKLRISHVKWRGNRGSNNLFACLWGSHLGHTIFP